MYIDVHTHPFHPKIAAKAIDNLHLHYGIKPVGNGLVEDILSRAKSAGLDKIVALCAATTVEQVEPANNFALKLKNDYPDKVIPFGTLHPHAPNWEEHIDFLKKEEVKGIKLHPDFQGFCLDDPALLPLLDAIGEDFVVMCHIGDDLPPKENPSCPYKLEVLRQKFPQIRFIAAHLGGYLHWEHALKTYIGKPIYIDTSSSLPFLNEEAIKEILQKHPREFVLFGSDYPLFDPADEIELLQTKAHLTDTQIDEILGNAYKLLQG